MPSSLAGLPPGRYREWEQEFEVLPEGKVVVSGTSYLAGRRLSPSVGVGNVMRFAGVSLRDAVDMAGARPRELLGLPKRSWRRVNRLTWCCSTGGPWHSFA